MAEAEGLHLANFETNDLTQWTAQVVEGTNTFAVSASAALHGGYGGIATFDGTNNDAMSYYAFTARTELYLRGYFQVDADFSGGTGNLYLLGMRSTTSNRLFCRAVMSSGNLLINRFYHQNDSGAAYVDISPAITVSKNEMHYMEFHFKASSAAGANDGVAEFWYDGDLKAQAMAVDSDTITVNRVYAGNFGTIVPTNTSYIYIDDVKMSDAYIGAYAEEAAPVTCTIAESNAKQVEAITAVTTNDVTGTITEANRKQVEVVAATVDNPATIIDHSYVVKYSDIPQSYIDIIKQEWLSIPGESHAVGYRVGLSLLESADAKFAVNVTESGTPEMPTSSYLRASCATWGDYNHSTGWTYLYGEEDWYTNAAALAQTKAFLAYAKAQGFGLSAVGFGWCWDMTWVNGVTTGKDAVYKCGWAGSSYAGPEGNLAWGLDSGDTSITGNSVNMDSYINATRSYIAYCDTNSISTKVFFTTGPTDNLAGTENGYQREVKHTYIRNNVTNNGGYLFDFADILAWNNAGVQNTSSWVDGDGGSHTFQMIAADNLLDLDGVDRHLSTGYHYGQRGALRLGKALWVMLAYMAGWDGEPAGSANATFAESTRHQNENMTTAVVNKHNATIAEASKKQSEELIAEVANPS
ncbi:polysaccharide lyase, partial [Candidatus Pacearchaeota archaeon]|nr:polysaccharide lyase [Candidatus Pacearchaeota archaeon]